MHIVDLCILQVSLLPIGTNNAEDLSMVKMIHPFTNLVKEQGGGQL